MSTSWGGWLLCQPRSAAIAPCACALSLQVHLLLPSQVPLPAPGKQQPDAEVRTKLCFCRGEGQSPTAVAPLIWMLTYLLQVTFVECKQVITLAGSGGHWDWEGNAYFPHHISPIISNCSLQNLLTMLAAQRVNLFNLHTTQMTVLAHEKELNPNPSLLLQVTSNTSGFIWCFLQGSRRTAKLVKLS